MKSAFAKIHSGFFNYNSYASLDDWLTHIRMVLQGAKTVAELMQRGYPVIVNCSHGWDRTPQIVALAKIILCEDYRTIDGLRRLINFDFIGYSHRFFDRQYYKGFSESSPIFIQFLDCVHQIRNQFDSEFEFKSELLSEIAFAYTEARFEEFSFNTRKDIEENNNPGLSFWQYISENLHLYINKKYRYLSTKNTTESTIIDSSVRHFLEIETHPFALQPWTDLIMYPKSKSFIKKTDEIHEETPNLYIYIP